MPASIEVNGGRLVVDINGPDKLLAMKSHLEIPLGKVAGARPGAKEARDWLGIMHSPGAHIPKVLSAGRFYWWGEWSFWDVHDPEKTVAIELRDHHYRKLVLQVADPDSAIELIDSAVTARVH
jgi:hypothetical protein